MSITIHEQRFLLLLRSELNEQPLEAEERALFAELTPPDWNELMTLAGSNRLAPVLFEAFQRNPEIFLPGPVEGYLGQTAFQNSLSYYQKMYLLSGLLELMQEEKITGYILKGVSVNAMYPKEESRSFGDIDLYIPDPKEFRRFCDRLTEQGSEKREDDMTDYHESFLYHREGASIDVEVHFRLNTSWGTGNFDRRLQGIYEQGMEELEPRTIQVMESEIPILPGTLEAFYMLMHMFQHFMNKGFGIRLFCDWAVFWRNRKHDVDIAQFRQWIRRLRLERFLDSITAVCSEYLGMDANAYGWMEERRDETLPEELLRDVFDGGEFGKLDKNRMIVTTRKAGPAAYLMELHRQTKKRFPKAHKIPVFLPVLWVVTGLAFEYNNIVVRKISARAALESSSQRNQLAQKMRTFEMR